MIGAALRLLASGVVAVLALLAMLFVGFKLAVVITDVFRPLL